MRTEIKKILSMVLIGIMVGAIPAVAQTLAWTGQGADSVTTCSSGETPNLFWVFTTGGGNPSGSEKLTINGEEFSGNVPGGSSIVQFQTPFFDPNKINEAFVTFDPSILGNGNSNLVISHGCTSTQIPEFPTIALPIAAIIGLIFFFQHKKKKEE